MVGLVVRAIIGKIEIDVARHLVALHAIDRQLAPVALREGSVRHTVAGIGRHVPSRVGNIEAQRVEGVAVLLLDSLAISDGGATKTTVIIDSILRGVVHTMTYATIVLARHVIDEIGLLLIGDGKTRPRSILGSIGIAENVVAVRESSLAIRSIGVAFRAKVDRLECCHRVVGRVETGVLLRHSWCERT